jgi:hypothetical protein
MWGGPSKDCEKKEVVDVAPSRVKSMMAEKKNRGCARTQQQQAGGYIYISTTAVIYFQL